MSSSRIGSGCSRRFSSARAVFAFSTTKWLSLQASCGPGGVGECPIAFAQACRYENKVPLCPSVFMEAGFPRCEALTTGRSGQTDECVRIVAAKRIEQGDPQTLDLGLPAQSSGRSRRT